MLSGTQYKRYFAVIKVITLYFEAIMWTYTDRMYLAHKCSTMLTVKLTWSMMNMEVDSFTLFCSVLEHLEKCCSISIETSNLYVWFVTLKKWSFIIFLNCVGIKLTEISANTGFLLQLTMNHYCIITKMIFLSRHILI